MKALLVCSIHSLFDPSPLEHRANSDDLTDRQLGDAATQSPRTAGSELFADLALNMAQREVLTRFYLEELNDLLWSFPGSGYASVQLALRQARAQGIKRGFISEYPLLTTNLARSAVLRTEASSLGVIYSPNAVEPMCKSLRNLAASLRVQRRYCRVLVAHPRDFEAAAALGMHPEFVEETRGSHGRHKQYAPAGSEAFQPCLTAPTQAAQAPAVHPWEAHA
ncbi:MAG: hypothetical protein MK180_06010 [Rhodobacteraceae bacterium]|nr:hypothetical protein [Paracoccaceae bacterium]